MKPLKTGGSFLFRLFSIYFLFTFPIFDKLSIPPDLILYLLNKDTFVFPAFRTKVNWIFLRIEEAFIFIPEHGQIIVGEFLNIRQLRCFIDQFTVIENRFMKRHCVKICDFLAYEGVHWMEHRQCFFFLRVFTFERDIISL